MVSLSFRPQDLKPVQFTMSTHEELLAQSVESTKALIGRYLAGFDDQTALMQPQGLPNHVIWNLGHLSLTLARVTEKLDGRPPDPTCFSSGDKLPHTFSLESVAFGSKPLQPGHSYPSLARATEILNISVDRLAAAVRSAGVAKLQESTPWGNASTTFSMLIIRMVFHNGFHTGQIADTRRALNMKSVFA